MARAQTIDVGGLIDARKLNGFNARIVVICWLIMFFEGYDLATLAVAGPALMREWGIHSMAAMGYAFSAVLFATILGTPLFGWIGDRFGRKNALILACLGIGVFSLVTMFVTSLAQMIVVRLFTGLAIGGIAANTLALNAEFAPRRVRATLMIVMFTGITLGAAIPGAIGPRLIPVYGWQALFFIGGVTPLIMAAVAALFLPESVKFLVLRGRSVIRIRAILRRLDAGTAIGATTQFVITDEKTVRNLSPALLFKDGLGGLTTLLWIINLFSVLSLYFISFWLPSVMAMTSFKGDAPYFQTLFQTGGTIGGLAVARPVDKIGLLPVFIMFLVAIPFSCGIGFTTGSETLAMIDVAISGFFVLGLQFALNAAGALIYPTSLRATGSAWSGTLGRVGAVAGPSVAGIMLGTGMSIQTFYMTLVVPLGLGAVAAFFFARLYYRRFHGHGFERERIGTAAAD
ncbi:MAG TPA: MFS transporter [Stellaceae bacterium]|jgi:AAHS family 4-hydroxybenzoate transporter-like MFS transporter|nr:MFS transporter [Stellaceae bacterium]